jgi:hypothetical protein
MRTKRWGCGVGMVLSLAHARSVCLCAGPFGWKCVPALRILATNPNIICVFCEEPVETAWTENSGRFEDVADFGEVFVCGTAVCSADGCVGFWFDSWGRSRCLRLHGCLAVGVGLRCGSAEHRLCCFWGVLVGHQVSLPYKWVWAFGFESSDGVSGSFSRRVQPERFPGSRSSHRTWSFPRYGPMFGRRCHI